jgi:hypothetical protein
MLLGARVHVESANGSAEQNRVYCTKPEGRIAGPWEYGTMIGKGQRTDLKKFVEASALEPLTEQQLIEEFTEITAKYPRFVTRVLAFYREASVATVPFTPLNGWQSDLHDYLQTRPDRRKISWYYEPTGGVGKTTFVHGFSIKSKYVITGGKHADIYYAYNYEEVVFFDLPRDMEDKVPYSVMESFKNGYFLSTKYECRRVKFNVPHVVVFANFLPDRTKLSEDRWDIQEIC